MTHLLLLKRFWYAVPIALLLAALLITRGMLAETKKDLKAEQQALATEKAEHQVTLASVSALKHALDEQNAAVNALKAEADRRVKASQEALRQAQSANKAQADQIDRLKVSGSEKRSGGPCTVSDTLKGVRGL